MPRILVVDDSPVERHLVGALLTKHLLDVTVNYAEDGVHALEVLKTATFDVILTDFQMPNLDGLELLSRATKSCPWTPVVVMTGCGCENTAVKALQAGAASYLPKRDIDTRLVETIHNILVLSQSRTCRRRILGSLTRQSATFTLENDVLLVTPLINWMQEQLLSLRLCNDAQALRIGVALHESLTNAIYHGNLGLDSELRQADDTVFYELANRRRQQSPWAERRVYVTTTMTPDEACYQIRDEGDGFDVNHACDPTDAENLLRIGGRGMLLIRSFMDSVSHNETGNEITLVKRFPRASATEPTSPVMQQLQLT